MKNNKRIKIDYVSGTESNPLFSRIYEAFKSYENNGDKFHRHGRTYDIKGIFGFIRGNNGLEITIASGVSEDIKEYGAIKGQRKIEYLMKQNKKRKL